VCCAGWPFAAWAAAFLSGYTACGSWFDWTLEWQAEARGSEAGRVHTIQFEELKLRAREEVARLARFLEVSGWDDPALIDRVVEQSSFEAMKGAAERLAAERPGDHWPGATAHIRKGITGDWANHFTADNEALALKEEFLAAFRQRCAGSGLAYWLGDSDGFLTADSA
jgi:hypothetical protein